jgi:hypothetical protein
MKAIGRAINCQVINWLFLVPMEKGMALIISASACLVKGPQCRGSMPGFFTSYDRTKEIKMTKSAYHLQELNYG